MPDLKAAALRKIGDPTLPREGRVGVRCELAKLYTAAGDYDAAREVLADLWRGVGERPAVDGLDDAAAAEVLLRAGVLTGWIGSYEQIEGAQESAKNLISESAGLFEKFGERLKVCEARTELATCYWREGAFDEARILLGGALDLAAHEPRGEQRLVALLRLAIVESSARRYEEALRILSSAGPDFEQSADHILRGKFHNELANVWNSWRGEEGSEEYIDRALVEYTAASYHFEQARHLHFQAAVENNIGFLYLSIGRFDESRKHLERARRLFVRLRDRAGTAQVDENRAALYLAEKLYLEAERVARQSVRALERGGEQFLLSQALITHGKALARLAHPAPARAEFERAVEVALRSGNPEQGALALLTLIEELRGLLPADDLRSAYLRAEGLLGDNPSAEYLHRLRAAAAGVLSAYDLSHEETSGPTVRAAGFGQGFSLREEVCRLEEYYIDLALREAGGKVSHAAKLLGFSDHGSLTSLLRKKHRKLLNARFPVTPRKSSIFKKK